VTGGPRRRYARLAASAVGVLAAVPLTLASCGEPERPTLGVSTSSAYADAARLALSDAEAAGSLPLEPVFIGEGTAEARPALSAARQFVAQRGLVAVVGHSNSSASVAASQIYNEHQVVQIAPSASAVVYSEAGPYSFRLVPPDTRQAGFIASEVAEALPAGGRLALLYVNDDYGRGLRMALQEALRSTALRTVLEIPYVEGAPEAEDMRQTGEAIAAARPDVILWLGRASVLHDYLPTFRATAPAARIVGSDGVAARVQLADGDGRWSGVRHVDFLDLGATAGSRDFARRYRQRYGRAATVPDALTYDATRLLIAAIDAGATSGPEVREYLNSLGRSRPPFQGVTGPIRFDERGDVDRGYVVVARP
jgi:branched-chain amino acid transport system substrate-binding protein